MARRVPYVHAGRLTYFDFMLEAEPSAAYAKGHNIYTRRPAMDRARLQLVRCIFEKYASETQDVIAVNDGGVSRASTDAKKQLSSIGASPVCGPAPE